jgi:hypothetical protein
VTELLDPPQPVEVEVDETGRPWEVRGAPFTGPARVVQRWIVEVDWWTSEPVARECWLVVLREQLMCVIYQDRADGTWYVERVYD